MIDGLKLIRYYIGKLKKHMINIISLTLIIVMLIYMRTSDFLLCLLAYSMCALPFSIIETRKTISSTIRSRMSKVISKLF